MHIITSPPAAKYESGFVTIVANSGGDRIELALSPFDAKLLCYALRGAAEEAIASRTEHSAQIIAFPAKRVRRA